MATQNFQIFDESLTDIDTDLEYQAESQRINGVTPGLASPKLHNKLYRQCSVMAYAIATVLAARGYDAKDDDPATLVDSIQRAFAFSVNGNKPNASGAITAVRPIDAWPIGSLFMTFQNVNPSTLLGGGTWVQIKGRYLLAADDGDTVDGLTTVGAHTKNVPLVAHTHGFETSVNGWHDHWVSGWTGGAGSHNHWTMNDIHTASFDTQNSGKNNPQTDIYFGDDGRYGGGWRDAVTSTVGDHSHYLSFGSSANGSHNHNGTTASAGTSASFDVRPASVYVYMWRRTA